MGHKNKGFTAVELMVAILIVGIISSATAAFILNINKTFHVSDTMVTLQTEGQTVSNKLSEVIMESEGIHELMLYNEAGVLASLKNSYHRETIDDSGENISFQYLNENDKVYHIFTLNNEGILEHSISDYENLSNKRDVEIIAGNMKSISISPVHINGRDDTIADSPLLEIELEFKKKDIDFKSSTQVKYRN